MAVVLEESRKARLINTGHVDRRVDHGYCAVPGDVFHVVRPEIDAGTERAPRQDLLGILEEILA